MTNLLKPNICCDSSHRLERGLNDLDFGNFVPTANHCYFCHFRGYIRLEPTITCRGM